MKILLINEGKDCSNWGLQASSKALLEIFETRNNFEVDIISHKELHQKYDFDPFIFGKKIFNENSRTHKFFSKLNLLIPTTADQYEIYTELWLKGKGGAFSREIISKIEKSDLVFFNAEGSTYRKNFGSLAGLFILFLSSFKFRKRAYFINGSFTISSIDNVLTGIAKKLFENNVSFYVREPYSLKDLLNINIKAELIPDSVFYYAGEKELLKNNLDINLNNYFAVSKSMLPMIQDYFDRDNLDAYLELIINLSKQTNLNPLFLVKDNEDKSLIKFKKYFQNAKVVSRKSSFKEVQGLISQCKFLISGRYHHLIFACNTSTNICCLSSSSHKVEGLSALLSSQSKEHIPVYDPTNIKSNNDSIIKYCIGQLNKQPMWDQNELKINFIDGMQRIVNEI